ncbi:MAG: hypothetical protein KDA61_01730 [Planctomycetales bacterium]|nr:hypothetical protein [Planctomycetales bacterium]
MTKCSGRWSRMSNAMLVGAFVVQATLGNAAEWRLVDPPMATRWAHEVDPTSPWPEYPRPQLQRADWLNLNGLWNYAVVEGDAAVPAKWDGKILTPYPIESALSGVKRAFSPHETLVYQRSFETPASWHGRRVLLHFGAVDYRTEVFVNGRSVGTHVGGYDPFSFDVTDLLTKEGAQELVVKVADPTWTGGQPRGKQTLSPAGIMYTPTSGIWQTVWLEPVDAAGIEDLHIVPDVKGKRVEVTVDLLGNHEGEVVVAVEGVSSASGKSGEPISVAIPEAKLWSPDDPHLYSMSVQVKQSGKVVDEAKSYFGMRSIERSEVDGKQQFLLSGEQVFMFGPLDQGFWPDGVYTAPTDEALRYDLEVIKRLEFNMIRKHIKVEPARWYYHADRLGLLVWQDMPSANSYDTPPGGKPQIDKEAYETQLAAMLDNLENHPSIVMWVVFNEGQGQHDTAKLVNLVRRIDPTRLVNQASGGRHEGVGDVYDQHPYPAPRSYEAPASQAFALGEYGGIGLKVGDNNPWQSNGWGYTNTQTGEELENLYARYAGMLKTFKEENALTSAIYTQITDVEIEVNGLMTYDRQLKVDPEWIAKANRFEWGGPKYRSVVPTSKTAASEYRYTLAKPSGEWAGVDVDDSDWETGQGGFGSEGTPGIGKIGVAWDTPDIWLRRRFTLPALSEEDLKRLVLEIHHDEDVEVYLNGTLAFQKEGFTSNYEYESISEAARSTLKPGGKNLISVHCRQTRGGQYIDVGLGVLDPNRR